MTVTIRHQDESKCGHNWVVVGLDGIEYCGVCGYLKDKG